MFVALGTTRLVQPIDVVFNSPFKAAVDKLAMEHLHENIYAYLHGDICASKRRVLLTGWTGQAWEEISSKKEMVRQSFKKCGISVAVDGSEGLADYAIDDDEAINDEEEDPFADIDN